jgi:hypothetical protein
VDLDRSSPGIEEKCENAMMMPRRLVSRLVTAVLSGMFALSPVRAEPPARASARPLPDWVKKSNQNAKLMIELMAKLQPELAARLGVEGYDHQITDQSPGFVERRLKATRQVHAELAWIPMQKRKRNNSMVFPRFFRGVHEVLS